MHLPVVDFVQPRPALWDAGPRSIAAVRVLRISITDRCNFRCVYCMPESGVPWLGKDRLLSLEEIAAVVRAAVEVHGIRRFKLTGGEPTVRPGLVELVRLLRRIDGIEDLSLTTNGMLLETLAWPLKSAGLDRITISIDSLRPARFAQITRSGDLSRVLRGLDAAERAGFASLKINCVTMRGTNDDEYADFARLSIARRLTVRFIEYMPLGDAALMHSAGAHADGGQARSADERPAGAAESGPAGGCDSQDRGADAFIAESEVRERIESELGPLVSVNRASEAGVGPAVVYRMAAGSPRGRIGFISAMSAPFCATCNRLRLTADGQLRSCLFEGGQVDLRPHFAAAGDAGALRRALAESMAACVRLKPMVHTHHGDEQMSRIGG